MLSCLNSSNMLLWFYYTGDLLPQYRDVILPSVLSGVKDEDPFVRASSLSNLGEICKLLQFSLGNIIQEVRYKGIVLTNLFLFK